MQTDQVFISHTSDMARFPEDKSYVQAVLEAVGRAKMAPVDMSYFAARDGKPADYCRQRVRECEIYVAVIGFRYGSMVPGEDVSYTELEFREATIARKPRLAFLLADSADLPAELTDIDRTASEGFRQRLRNAGLIVPDFSSYEGLVVEVLQALLELRALPRGVAQAGTASPLFGVRYSLPPDTAAFTGRDQELSLITAAVTDAAATGAVVAIHATPGAGKTALAVHLAHRLGAQFPDRQLFIDLHGHTPGQDPVAPEAALAGLLTAAGVDTRYLPADLEGREGKWRDRMADQRALLVLDNAASSDQVRPLLPGSEGCLVLITSRRHLGDLPGLVLRIALEAMSPAKAQEMFLRLAPRALTGPEAAVPELARLTGYLPLGISLLARVYARHPSWTLADLIRETKASLLTLAAERDSIAAAFDVSYRYLTPSQQQFFRRLGLHPGTTLDAYAAAALAGIPLQEAVGQLDALQGEGMLTEVSYRRYGMHDLIRLYAVDRAAADPEVDRNQGLARLLDYYQYTAAMTEATLARQSRTVTALTTPPDAVPDLSDRTQALAWARIERASVLACLDYATRTGQQARVVALSGAIAALLRQDGPWTDAITRHATAVQAARHLGDRLSEANGLSDLGVIRQLTGDYPGASADLEAALGIYRSLGDRRGQAYALNHLGLVQYLVGDSGAAESFDEALSICRDIGDRLGQAYALDHMGGLQRVGGNNQDATESLEAALDIYRDLGDRLGEANALDHLGAHRRITADYPAATEALVAALGIYSDIGDRRGQANALTDIAAVRRMTGDYPGADEALVAALGICRDIGDRLGQANALVGVGEVRYLTGNYPAAAEALEAALKISRDIGGPASQASALAYLGVVRRLTGDYPGAEEALEEALEICRSSGDRGGEAEVLNELGTLHRVSGDLDRAGALHRQALELAREIDSSWDEAHALAGLGRCAQAAGNIPDAADGLRQALQIFQRIGAAETSGVAAELDALTGQEATA